MQRLQPEEIHKKYMANIGKSESEQDYLTDQEIQDFVNKYDIDSLVPNYKMLVPTFSSHTVGSSTEHEVENYKTCVNESLGVYVSWGYCKECGKIRYQRIMGYDPNFFAVYVRDIIDKGEPVEQQRY